MYFVRCYKAQYIIRVFILWSWQRRLLRLCICNIYSQYNTALYTYINVCICARTGIRCTYCVHVLATGLKANPGLSSNNADIFVSLINGYLHCGSELPPGITVLPQTPPHPVPSQLKKEDVKAFTPSKTQSQLAWL